MKATLLVVDDAPEFVELLEGLFTKEGYEVVGAADGQTGIDMVEKHSPDVVILDLTLPDLDGMEVLRQIRQRSDTMVLMLTARVDEVDRVLGLKTGADDYVTKPFSPRELLARVEALLRRSRPQTATSPDDRRELDGLVVHPLAREVELDGESVALTRIEFDILEALSSRPDMVFSRSSLREQVWGPNWFGDDHVVDVHIANLRRKIDLGVTDSRIRTIRGIGYRMNT